MSTTTRSPDTRTGLLGRLAGWSQTHHWVAIGLWVVTLVGITAGSTVIGNDYRNDTSLPGTESQQVLDAFEEHAPAQSGDTVTVVVQSDGGLDGVQPQIEGLVAELGALDHVAAVTPPSAETGTVSEDGTIGLITVALDDLTQDVPTSDREALLDTALDHDGDGIRVELTGDAVREVQESEAAGGGAEGVGMIAALVVLVFMFGSLLAASLPIITAVLAVGTAFGLVMLASHLTDIPDFTGPFMLLVGLGVGIDYALLVFSRYRSELLNGASGERATLVALETAGRSVLFAGATVIIALFGLYLLGGALQGAALAVSITVLLTMLSSLTLLPSLLTILGKPIERRVRKHAAKARREPGARWRRWANLVMRYPVPSMLVGLIALGALAFPALDMRLGFADPGNDDPSTTSRQAYDLIAEGFGPGASGPLFVVTEGDEATAQATYEQLQATAGVASATPPQASPDGAIYTSLAFPESSPQDEETTDLVHDLRDSLPEESLVGGSTAAAVDYAVQTQDQLPLFIGVVVGLSALLLMLVFGSVLIALKAAVLNLLSIGAALGAVTLVFQDGRWFAEPGPIEAFVPVIIFAIVFGLSMDYEVFLISRMHEEWQLTGDSIGAVREGMAKTGGVITAAATIMVVVFGGFLLFPDRMLQQFGLGLALAVLLDALIIRCLIVPAAMRLFGDRAWWGPRPLVRED